MMNLTKFSASALTGFIFLIVNGKKLVPIFFGTLGVIHLVAFNLSYAVVFVQKPAKQIVFPS